MNRNRLWSAINITWTSAFNQTSIEEDAGGGDLLFAQAVLPPACLKCLYSSVGKRTTKAILRITQHLHTPPLARWLASTGVYHCSLSSTRPSFKAMVSCPTRGERTIDLIYTNVKEGLVAIALHLLGSSDHNMVALMWLANCRSHSNCLLLVRRCIWNSARMLWNSAQILSGLCVLTVTMNNKSWVTNTVKAAINREEKQHFIEGTRTGTKMLNGN